MSNYEYPEHKEIEDMERYYEKKELEKSHELNEKGTILIAKILTEIPEYSQNFYIVGKWIWCKFKETPPQRILDFLYNNGFKWNQRRMVFQNSCGLPAKFNSKTDPEEKYGKTILKL
jgi:hypothetical protein